MNRRPTPGSRHPHSFPPLGLLYLGTVLQQHGHEVRLCDMSVEGSSKQRFTELLRDFRPDLVGVGFYAPSYSLGLEVARCAKQIRPECRVVVGGPLATFIHAEILQTCPAVDAVVMYEGEETIVSLADLGPGSALPAALAGIACRREGAIVCTERPPRLRDLDQLPFPNRDLIRRDLYSTPFTLSSGRGCPSNCVFCSSRAYWGGRCILRSAASLVDEVEYLWRRYPTMRWYAFADDTLLLNRKRGLELCSLLVPHGHGLPWSCLARVDEIDDEMVAALAAAHCRLVKVGIESASDTILSAIGKRTTRQQIEQALAGLSKARIQVVGSIIIGLPGDSVASAQETVAFAEHLQKEYGVQIQVGINTPFPGTPQYENADQWGLRIKSRHWDWYNFTRPVASVGALQEADLRRLYADALARLHGEDRYGYREFEYARQ